MSVGAAIAGVAMALPERMVSNDQLAAGLGVDAAWIAKRTGTHERPWASDGERLSQLSAEAARAALGRAGVAPGDVDLVLVATSTADEITPNAAPLVAGLIGAGRAEHALVVGADFLSRFLDVSDRDTAPLFADGAGAAVVSATRSPAGRVGPIVLRADHSGSHLIRLNRGELIRMEGHESFRAAVSSLTQVTAEALAAADRRLEDIDLFVYHQANSRIISAVGERLGLPADRVVDYVGRFANASTATLPIALTVAQAEGRLEPGARILLAAFGGGLTWGGTVVEWIASAVPVGAGGAGQPSVMPTV
jgi:3-oxoacyl-[acyl-carrier-protein] synthase III